MRTAALLLLFGLPLQAEIHTLFSDKGIVGDNVFTWPQDGTGSWDGDSTAVTPPEGFKSFRTQSATYAGWGLFHDSPQDLSRFLNGQLLFWLRYDTQATLQAEIEHFDGYKLQWSLFLPQSSANQWVQVQIPLSGLPPPYDTLTNIKGTFLVTATTPCTFFVDRVRYKTSQAVFELNTNIRNITDEAVVSQFAFPQTLSPTWVRSLQWMEVEIDPDSEQWGLQLYTQNTAADASPRFQSAAPSGQSGSNPAGLVDAGDASKRLPAAWKIQATGTAAPSAGNPQAQSGFGWLNLKDSATPTIVSENTTAFANGEPYVTVADQRGIHWGPQSIDFGAENVPYRLYLEADFSLAITPRTYQTNKLILEYYYP